MAQNMIHVVFIDNKIDSVIPFFKEEDAIKFIEKKWHELMRFHHFSKLDLITASEEFKESKHKSYVIRDLDGHLHSAKLISTIVL
jgi:hypothetical protein